MIGMVKNRSKRVNGLQVNVALYLPDVSATLKVCYINTNHVDCKLCFVSTKWSKNNLRLAAEINQLLIPVLKPVPTAFEAERELSDNNNNFIFNHIF